MRTGRLWPLACSSFSVPLLLHSWGSTRLGLWLLLAAAPAALAVADCGITVTSGNAMTAAVARGDTGEAGRLLAQAVRFVRPRDRSVYGRCPAGRSGCAGCVAAQRCRDRIPRGRSHGAGFRRHHAREFGAERARHRVPGPIAITPLALRP